MSSEVRLPFLASYKPKCIDSSHSWVVYQSSLTELRLVEFNIDFIVKQSLNINVSSQPLKAVKILYSEQEKTVYVGIALLTKYLILKKSQVIHQYSLPLKCNIADFSDGFTGVEAVNDGMQIYFVFVTSKGQIMTVPVHDLDKVVMFNIVQTQKIVSLATKNTIAYLGTENGFLLKVDMNSKQIVGKYNTLSDFPILNTLVIGQHVLITTCDGEIHILDEQLKEFRAVTAHQAFIYIVAKNGNKIFSIGQDLVLRVWQFTKTGTLQHIKQEEFKRRPNALFTLFDRTFIGFYEETLLQQI